MKIRDLIKMIEQDGWYYIGSRGSHRQFKHPSKAGRVTVPGKGSDDVSLLVLKSVRKQAGLEKER